MDDLHVHKLYIIVRCCKPKSYITVNTSQEAAIINYYLMPVNKQLEKAHVAIATQFAIFEKRYAMQL